MPQKIGENLKAQLQIPSPRNLNGAALAIRWPLLCSSDISPQISGLPLRYVKKLNFRKEY